MHKPVLLQQTSFSRAVFDRHGTLLRLTLAADQKYRLFVPLDAIAPNLHAAVLLHEDQYFFNHPGVNPASLFRAAWQSFAGGRKIGASTITMQLARLRYGIHSRSVPGKLWQIARALQLELHYSKKELLEAYFNLVPYGYNIEGIGAASLIYFHQKPAALTLPQAITLAVIPQSPTLRRPEAANAAKPALLAARNRLFQDWRAVHPEDKTQALFFALPLATHAIADLPFTAPHLTGYLLAHSKAAEISATIDRDTHLLLERLLVQYVRDRHEVGIDNASALLIDTHSMQAVASIGSADFANRAISGQVDGTRARRSPGSALKPFIYALAFDQGLIHPMTMLGDAPTSMGSFSPDNFDRDFRGPIPAADALRLSRNVPAIKLAKDLHKPDFYEWLGRAGIAKLAPREELGLSLVLGGAPVTMRELAALYAALANNGQWRPLRFDLADATAPPRQVLSAEASFLTLDSLRDTPRPYTAATQGIPIYWKTGTSNGFHDAWTAGVFGHYALVVWAGNFNGKSNPALVGVRSAAPLFFLMEDAVAAKMRAADELEAKAAHLHLARITLCAVTGDVALEGCPARAESWFIPGVSPIRSANIYRSLLVNRLTGERACRFVAGIGEYRTFEVWPSDLAQTLEKAGIHKSSLPPWEQGCAGDSAAEGQKPVILSPQARVAYHARAEASDEDAIALRATSDGEAALLYWFVGNQFIGSSQPGETRLWHPRPGQFDIRVVDDLGHADTTRISVSLAE